MLDRQDLLKGDLHLVQELSLLWLMNKEIEENQELELNRARSVALASNPTIQGDYLKTLFKQDSETSTGADEFVEEDISWVTPQSQEELDELEELLRGT